MFYQIKDMLSFTSAASSDHPFFSQSSLSPHTLTLIVPQLCLSTMDAGFPSGIRASSSLFRFFTITIAVGVGLRLPMRCEAGIAETQIGQNCPRYVDQGDGQSGPQLVVKLVCNITQYLRYLRPVHDVSETIKVK